jgi:hypothetical protein
MALTKFGFIMSGPEYHADTHTTTLNSPGLATTFVGVGSLEEAVTAAKTMVAEGIQLIELCGWFGPVGAARIIEEIDRAVPVGFVAHGPDFFTQMHELFSE